MKTIYALLGLIVIVGCQPPLPENTAQVTFQIDMSDEIANVSDTTTLGLIGTRPPLQRREVYPLTKLENGIYEAVVDFTVVDFDTLKYAFTHSGQLNNADLGMAAFNLLPLTPTRIKLPLVKWGVPNVDIGRAIPAPLLEVFQADTEAEEAALAEPFVGITADGKLQEGLYSIKATEVSTDEIRKAAETFLGSLNQSQRDSCMFPIDASEWRRWTNIDFYKRKGIGLPDLSDEQRELAFNILKTSLSTRGFRKTQNIMKMEGYLARLTGEFDKLGPDLYWFTFMGTPSRTEPWGWQIDGHHLVINYFVLGDQVVMTPTFMGSEPNYILDGENKGTRTFELEEKIGLKFYRSLNFAQSEDATLHDQKDYNFNQAESFRDNAVIKYQGFNLSDLKVTQEQIFRELIGIYIGNMKKGHAQIKTAEVMAHIDDTYFAWVGSRDGTGPFYYRIHSPVILIEFDHHAPVFLEGHLPTKKHVHTVVRTPNGNDYGKDLLRQHLENHPH